MTVLTNNSINLMTSSYGWTAYTGTISGTATNPTLGAGATIFSYYLQFGKLLFVSFSLVNAAGSTNGGGNYLFNIPSQFTLDQPISSGLTVSSIGEAQGLSGTTPGAGFACATGNRSFMMLLITAPGVPYFASSTFFNLSTGCYLSANLQMPILG